MIMWAQIIKVSPQYGALVVYADRCDYTIKIKALDGERREYYADTKKYESDNKTICAAAFPHLPPGNYLVQYWYYGEKRVTVFPGAIAEVSFRA